LTTESKPVDQGLFTTLSTTTRAVHFLDRKVLLTDTVGFIDRLPLTLIEAFRSTLEETVLSDAIILVIDFQESVKEIHRKLSCCQDTLNEIGAYDIPIVTALNKIDLLSEERTEEKLASLVELVQNPMPISALNGFNIDGLKQKVVECLDDQLEASFALPFSSEAVSFISNLYNQVNILDTHYEGKEIKITLRATPWLLDKVFGQIEKLGGQLLVPPYESKLA
jgi:GTP-binding protein HflX